MKSLGEIAIVGYACRVPGARDISAFWRLLRGNQCSVTSITPDRFPTQSFLHPAPDQAGRSYTFAAGVIDDVWGFDAAAFGMSPREAEQVDPQHRHLLEVSYDALAHAGIRPSSLAGSDTGVYVGASSADHALRFFVDPTVADVHMMTGNSLSIMANRLSYAMDLRGPSLTIDTACSSSLVALHLAAEAIRNGTIDTAIVAGVNLLLSPYSYVGFSRAMMLSPTGLCRPFDSAADGYVRAEGVITVVLRSMAEARRARNRIYGVIVGSGMNQDGRTTGLSLPSAESQRALLERLYEQSAIDPADLLFVEAHGTGTPVGDPIEADALGKGLAQRRAQALPIGSVKSNIGHLEPVSGLAGLLKSALALDHGLVPATLHQQAPSPNIPFDELNLKVVDRNWKPPERRGAELAGVNSFGFGGTNAHAIVRSDNAKGDVVYFHNNMPPPPLLLTAHSSEALPALAAAYTAQWPAEPRSVPAFVGSAAHLRDHLPHRLLIRGGSNDELRHHVQQYANGEKPASMLAGYALGNNLPVAFLFSGNGAQWVGMGKAAWQANAPFREALREVNTHFARVQSWSIVDELLSPSLPQKIRRATYSQPLLLALQVATVKALEEAGVTATATLGHSVGEITAAWAAGALSLEQAIDVVSARSRHQEAAHGAGGMAALMLSEREAHHFLKTSGAADVDVAAINSWRSVTISGPSAEIDRILALTEKARISGRRLDLDYPFHSALVDPVRAPLLRELDGLKPMPLRRKMVSCVTGELAEGESLDAHHWWRNVREPVRFDAALNCLIKDDFRVFVEIGPRPILASYVRDVLRESSARGIVVETMNEHNSADTTDPIEQAVGKILIAGGSIDLDRYFGSPPAVSIALPLYPWQHTSFVVQPTVEATTILTAPSHPLLGRRHRLDNTEWFSTVDPDLFPWIADHKVGDIPVFPATAYVEVMLAVAREIHGDSALEIRDLDIIRPLVFDGRTSYETLLRFSPETGLVEFLSRARRGGRDWTLNARGVAGRSPIVGVTARTLNVPAGTVVVTKPKVYECARALGFGYGKSFQRIRHVTFPHPKRAVGALEAPANEIDSSFISDLTGLDAAFHALFASEEAGVADMPMKRMLPIRFGNVRMYRSGAVATNVSARTRRQSLTSLVVDIELYDAEGLLILSAETVRLVEAPGEAATGWRSLSYHSTAWRLERAGERTSLDVVSAEGSFATKGASSLGEGLLLLEAGCLRSAWQILGSDHAMRDEEAEITGGAPPWQSHYRSALLWHLEARGLAVERNGRHELAATCELPEITSIVSSLAVRHPTMIAEAASLARIDEIFGDLIADPHGAPAQLSSSHWRHLGASAKQTLLLRDAVFANLEAAIKACDQRRLLRVLVLGGDHIATARDLAERFPNLELTVTDLDPDRLDEVRLTLGDPSPRITCVPWTALPELAAAAFDIAVAVDALSEIAATSSGLSVVKRLLRPGAQLAAGELAPALFWDIVRGTRPLWWDRSVNMEFPVGALLTREEWIDELQNAGFDTVAASPLAGEAHVGTAIQCIAGETEHRGEMPAKLPLFRWEGDQPSDQAVSSQLRARLKEHLEATTTRQAELATSFVGEATASADIIWTIDATSSSMEASAFLTGHLAEIADRCRSLAASPARLWILMDFGDRADDDPLSQPLWCAISSAMRVAQNEYAGLDIRCLGLIGTGATVVNRAIEELLLPDEEREVFVAGDMRTVVRVQRGIAPPAKRQDLTNDAVLSLASRHGASRGNLAWVTTQRPEPGPGEIEIAVVATGLNFRDVMWNLRLLPEEALEDGYAGPGLGMECAGIVSRIGPAVEAFQVGDRVVAFAPQAFASYVIAPCFAASPLPETLSFEAASAIPVAFLTAYYSLVHLGQLARGETVLIHGGAGAVGMAAIQIARHRGAKVIASAGSDEKRAFLRRYGVDCVCNSRSLAFADDVREYTEGKGVDVVLNSLAGEAMVRSMDCLRPFGRFIELGKRDFYANTHLGLRPLRRNLSYFGVDIDQLIGEHRDLAQRLFGEITELLWTGDLVPIPHRIFPGSQVDEAFRLMQRAGHLGKIVVTPADQPSDMANAGGVFPVDARGVHVVIGGTSGFGLATAVWLAGRGATRIVLASRSARLADKGIATFEAFKAKGVEIAVEQVDIADEQALGLFLRRCSNLGAIKGIVHAAMTIDDRLIERMDADAIAAVLRPKVVGALNLERAITGLELDYLLFYSSATTVFGNPGQYNYVAANAFMEGLARRMRTRGVPALAVSWGGIADAGYLARNIGADANLKKRFSANLISAETALNGLDWAFDEHGRPITASCVIARIDWGMAKRELAALRAPTFGAIGVTGSTRKSADSAAIIEKLRSMPAGEAAEALVEIVVEELSRVLRLPPKEIDRHRPLADIGMDSLMMLELRNTVEDALNVELPMMSISSGITPIDVARRIAPLVTGEQRQDVPGTIVALSGSHFAEEAKASSPEERQAAVGAVLERVRKLERPS